MSSTTGDIRLAIVGTRTFDHYAWFEKQVAGWIKEVGMPCIIISGGASGIDAAAARFAGEHNIPLREYKADWSKHGRAAGPMRNTLIVQAATHVLGFPSDSSVGTLDTMRKARKASRSTWIKSIDVELGDADEAEW